MTNKDIVNFVISLSTDSNVTIQLSEKEIEDKLTAFQNTVKKSITCDELDKLFGIWPDKVEEIRPYLYANNIEEVIVSKNLKSSIPTFCSNLKNFYTLHSYEKHATKKA